MQPVLAELVAPLRTSLQAAQGTEADFRPDQKRARFMLLKPRFTGQKWNADVYDGKHVACASGARPKDLQLKEGSIIYAKVARIVQKKFAPFRLFFELDEIEGAGQSQIQVKQVSLSSYRSSESNFVTDLPLILQMSHLHAIPVPPPPPKPAPPTVPKLAPQAKEAGPKSAAPAPQKPTGSSTPPLEAPSSSYLELSPPKAFPKKAPQSAPKTSVPAPAVKPAPVAKPAPAAKTAQPSAPAPAPAPASVSKAAAEPAPAPAPAAEPAVKPTAKPAAAPAAPKAAQNVPPTQPPSQSQSSQSSSSPPQSSVLASASAAEPANQSGDDSLFVHGASQMSPGPSQDSTPSEGSAGALKNIEKGMRSVMEFLGISKRPAKSLFDATQLEEESDDSGDEDMFVQPEQPQEPAQLVDEPMDEIPSPAGSPSAGKVPAGGHDVSMENDNVSEQISASSRPEEAKVPAKAPEPPKQAVEVPVTPTAPLPKITPKVAPPAQPVAQKAAAKAASSPQVPQKDLKSKLDGPKLPAKISPISADKSPSPKNPAAAPAKAAPSAPKVASAAPKVATAAPKAAPAAPKAAPVPAKAAPAAPVASKPAAVPASKAASAPAPAKVAAKVPSADLPSSDVEYVTISSEPSSEAEGPTRAVEVTSAQPPGEILETESEPSLERDGPSSQPFAARKPSAAPARSKLFNSDDIHEEDIEAQRRIEEEEERREMIRAHSQTLHASGTLSSSFPEEEPEKEEPKKKKQRRASSSSKKAESSKDRLKAVYEPETPLTSQVPNAVQQAAKQRALESSQEGDTTKPDLSSSGNQRSTESDQGSLGARDPVKDPNGRRASRGNHAPADAQRFEMLVDGTSGGTEIISSSIEGIPRVVQPPSTPLQGSPARVVFGRPQPAAEGPLPRAQSTQEIYSDVDMAAPDEEDLVDVDLLEVTPQSTTKRTPVKLNLPPPPPPASKYTPPPTSYRDEVTRGIAQFSLRPVPDAVWERPPSPSADDMERQTIDELLKLIS